MTDTNLAARIELLETRLAHQEVAIEELTRTLLGQERLVREQAATIKRLESLIRALNPSTVEPPVEDSPPPHY